MSKVSPEDFMGKAVTIEEAQSDMRKGYASGSLGVMVSGGVWLASAFVSYYSSADHAIWALLIGGALIAPISGVIEKFAGLNGHKAGNPFRNLAMESTVWMIMCLPIAYGLSMQNTEWFFQAMLLIIGGRYLTFATLFGKKVYWCLGASLGIAAYFLFQFKIQSFGSLLTGSIIEIIYGVIIYILHQKSDLNVKEE